MDATVLLGLLLWGTLVGVDLVTWPQAMIARPLVSGTVAGWVLGDPVTGAAIGMMLELFALDLLPVGAARYPDYGAATVGAVYLASGAPDVFGWGLAVLLGLGVAYLGQASIHLVRRWTAADVRRHAALLDSGDAAVIREVHLRSIARDALRALVVTGAGLVLAAVVRAWPPLGVRGAALLALVAVGAAIGVGMLGAVRLGGRGAGRVWLAAGLVTGVAWLVLR